MLGTELLKRISSALDVMTPIFMWSDSKVALTCIHTEPSFRIENFILNYVRSTDNPADIALKGSVPQKLVKNTLWWNELEFLKSCND